VRYSHPLHSDFNSAIATFSALRVSSQFPRHSVGVFGNFPGDRHGRLVAIPFAMSETEATIAGADCAGPDSAHESGAWIKFFLGQETENEAVS
jgi:hypothetical protein